MNLSLRKKLYAELKEGEHREEIYRRWRYKQSKLNEKFDLIYTEDDWSIEWKKIVDLASPEYIKSLEDLHVLALSYILKKPIIVYSDKFVFDVEGQPLSPNNFQGVYVPSSISPHECSQESLLLAYNENHFTPLAATKLHDDEVNLVPAR
jgi:hypothetical protein